MPQAKRKMKVKPLVRRKPAPENTKPDWTRKCSECGKSPIVPVTGMCGPCTFGEAETANGNW